MKHISILASIAIATFGFTETKTYTLDEAVKTALTKNNQVLSSIEAVKSAEGKEGEAFSGYLPKIALVGNYNYMSSVPSMSINIPTGPATSINKTIQTGVNDNWLFKAQLSQTIFDWGRMFDSHSAALAGKDAVDQEGIAVRNNTIHAVNQAFFGLVFAKEALKVSEESLRVSEEHLKNAEQKYKEGASSSFEVLRSKVQLSNLKPVVSKAASNVEMAKYNIKNILGLALSEEIEVDGAFKERPINELDYDSVILLCKQFRPELLAIYKKKEVLKKSLNVISSMDKPVLSGTASYNYQNPYYTQLSWTESWSAGLNLSIPVFDGNVTGSKVKQAEADLKSLEYSVKTVENGIELELKQLQLTLRELKGRTQAQKDAVAQAEEYHKIAQLGFKAGTMTNLEVMDAELSLLNVKMGFLQALYDREVTESAVVKCIGANSNIKSIIVH